MKALLIFGLLFCVQAFAQTIPATFVYLDKVNWVGTTHHTPGAASKVGSWPRGPTIAYSYETIAKFDLTSVSGTLQTAKLRFHVTGGLTSVWNTVTAFEANQGTWDPNTVKYDTFCSTSTTCVSWNNPLDSVNVDVTKPGWYEMSGSGLKSKVQQWVNSSSTNNGLVLSANFYDYTYEADIDSVQMVVSAEAPPTAPYVEWAHSAPVVINTSSTGANITSSLQNYPLLIRLDATNFNFGEANADGSDLRFSRTLSNGSVIKLPLQIERWDKTGQQAAVWVKVDQILGNNANQTIAMYWGNANPAMDSFDPVFNPTNGFLAVYHLGESGGTTSGGYKDATPTGNNATGHGTSVHGAAAQVGNGQVFNGNDDYISLPSFSNASHVTVSAWFKMDSLKSNQGILSNGQWTNGVVHFKNNTGALTADAKGGTTASQTGQTTGAWYLGTYTYTNGGGVQLYLNGALMVSGTAPANDWLGTNLEIGHEYTSYATGARFFRGTLDEARIETVIRSADWIKLRYENEKSNQSLVSVQRGTFLPQPGGTMFGNLNMGGKNLNNAGTVVARHWKVPIPDYVLDASYSLPSLASVEAYTKINGHLPDVPSAKELENTGLDLPTMSLRLLKQVEHLQLYVLENERRIKALKDHQGLQSKASTPSSTASSEDRHHE